LNRTVAYKIIAADYVQSLVAHRRLYALLTITRFSKELMKPKSQSQ